MKDEDVSSCTRKRQFRPHAAHTAAVRSLNNGRRLPRGGEVKPPDVLGYAMTPAQGCLLQRMRCFVPTYPARVGWWRYWIYVVILEPFFKKQCSWKFNLKKKNKEEEVCTQFDHKDDLNSPINYNDSEDLFLGYKNNLFQIMLKF